MPAAETATGPNDMSQGCRADGSKQFEVVSSDGWGEARKHVFPRLLQGEIEAARPDFRE